MRLTNILSFQVGKSASGIFSDISGMHLNENSGLLKGAKEIELKNHVEPRLCGLDRGPLAAVLGVKIFDRSRLS